MICFWLIQLVTLLGDTDSDTVAVPIVGFRLVTEELGSTIRFSVASDREAAVDTVQWQFGDGWTSQQRNPSHRYNQRGLYEVTVRIKSGWHHQTIRQEITVNLDESCDQDWYWPYAEWTGLDLLAVTAGAPGFVAVGERGVILFSEDGRRWCEAPFSRPERIYDVIWDGARYLAVGSHSLYFLGTFSNYAVVWQSTNGLDWRALAYLPNSLHGIVHHAGVYVAIGYGRILQSFDGEVWQRVVAVSSSIYHDVIWDGTMFRASGYFPGSRIGNPGHSDWTSSDGLEWQHHELDYSSSLGQLASGNGVIVSALSRFATLQADGTWLEGSGTKKTVHDLVFGDDMFVAVGRDGMIAYSEDGLLWTHLEPVTEHSILGVVWGSDGWVAVAENGLVLWSEDGKTWRHHDPEPRPSVPLTSSGSDEYGSWLAGGEGTVMEREQPHDPWRVSIVEPTMSVRALVRGTSIWALGNRLGAATIWERDQTDWHEVWNDEHSLILGGVSDGSKTYTYGVDGLLVVEMAGQWEVLPTPAQLRFVDALIVDSKLWLLAATEYYASELWCYEDGNWSMRTMPEYFYASAFSYKANLWVVVGNNHHWQPERAMALSSLDGGEWQTVDVPAFPLRDITWTGTKFVAVADAGSYYRPPVNVEPTWASILESRDGLQWTIPNQTNTPGLLTVNHYGGVPFSAGSNGCLIESRSIRIQFSK